MVGFVILAELYSQADDFGATAIRKEIGKLLYNVASKLKAQIKNHMGLLVQYISSKKITSEDQLNGKSDR